MATGTIDSINSVNGNLKSGTIKLDESGDYLKFTDQPIQCDAGDAVSFEIVIISGAESVADKVVCMGAIVDHPLSPLTTSFTGDIEIKENERLVIRGVAAKITGTIKVNGGKLRMAQGSEVNGKIIIIKSGTMRNLGSVVNGDIDADQAEMIYIGSNGEVNGKIIIIKSHRMVLDSGNINGSLQINDAYRVIINSNSKIGC